MKVFLSTDMEGTAGIVDWQQALGPGPEYERARSLLMAEVNAAIDGAAEAGATEFVVNDAHWLTRNLDPESLHGSAAYVSGRHKPMYMMEGIDRTFDLAFFVSYHGSMGGPPSVLSHTYNPDAVAEARLDGTVVGESGINALVAAGFEVPVGLVTGDDVTIVEAAPWFPGAELVTVKRSIGRMSAESLHPERARELIRDGARRAVEHVTGMRPPTVAVPAALQVDLRTADLATLATMVRGVEPTGPRTIVIEGDPIEVYRRFCAVLSLTRHLAAEAGGR